MTVYRRAGLKMAQARADTRFFEFLIFTEDASDMSTATKNKPAKKSDSGSIKAPTLGDRVVIEREESETKTSGGILLPESAKNKPARGKVVSVGDGRLLDDGTRQKLQVKVGDRVLFSSYAVNSSKSTIKNCC